MRALRVALVVALGCSRSNGAPPKSPSTVESDATPWMHYIGGNFEGGAVAWALARMPNEHTLVVYSIRGRVDLETPAVDGDAEPDYPSPTGYVAVDYDPTGTPQWGAALDLAGCGQPQLAFAVRPIPDGGAAVLLWTPNDAGEPGTCLSRIDGRGRFVWTMPVGLSGRADMDVDGAGTIVIVGETSPDGAVLALGPDGSERWRTPTDIRPTMVRVTPSRSIVVAGWAPARSHEVAVIGLSAEGEIRWQKILPSDDNRTHDSLGTLSIDTAGRIAVSWRQADGSVRVVQLDPDGDEGWSRTVVSSEASTARRRAKVLAATPDGLVLILTQEGLSATLTLRDLRGTVLQEHAVRAANPTGGASYISTARLNLDGDLDSRGISLFGAFAGRASFDRLETARTSCRRESLGMTGDHPPREASQLRCALAAFVAWYPVVPHSTRK